MRGRHLPSHLAGSRNPRALTLCRQPRTREAPPALPPFLPPFPSPLPPSLPPSPPPPMHLALEEPDEKPRPAIIACHTAPTGPTHPNPGRTLAPCAAPPAAAAAARRRWQQRVSVGRHA